MMGTLGTVKDAAIGWVVQRILDSLFTEKMESWSREVDVAGDVENLKSEMLSTNTVVDAARGRKIENEGLSRSLFRLKQLLYDAEDVMDELDYYRLQREIEGGNCDGSAAGTHPLGDRASSSAWSSSLQKTLNAVKQIPDWALGKHRKRKGEDDTLLALESKHDTISQRINKIVTQLRTAREDLCRVLQLEISRLITMPYQSQSEPRNTRLTTSMQVEKKVYGREAERNRVVELLMDGKYSDLHVLPIVGGGGVGKTTLAKYVCDDQRIGNHFALQMWVCVSTIFDPVRLTREMLEHVCKDGQDYGKISSFNVLQDTLLEKIRSKRFLLVLDDIWEDKDKNGWATLLAPLKRSQVPGCMILATTRSKSVAKMIGTMDAVEMKGLDEKEFWQLFKACAFGNENCTDHPSLHTIGQQIAKTLKGYPLAAQSVGALLKENLSYDHWRDVQETWKSRQENDGDILPILELSYDYLPSHLQHCFSYCSLFPEDHRFYGETLVRAWISQNFVQCEDTSKRLEEIGMRYLGRLVDLGFFQKVGSLYVMHDLMHELAEKVSSNECANINGLQSKTIQPCIRHLSIITTAYDKDEHGSFPSENFEKILQDIRPLQKLRTLMFFGRSSVKLLRTRSFQILFKDTKSLRLLRIYVTGADIDSVLNFVKPYHLRWLEFIFVCLNNEDIAFPEALTRFYHLQVLDFSYFYWKDTLSQDEYDNDMSSEFYIDTEAEDESSSSEFFIDTEAEDESSQMDGKMLSFHNLRFLTHLRIAGCRNLTSISFEGLRQLISLKSLEIYNCRKLFASDVLPEDTHEDMAAANSNILPSLERLRIVSCGIAGKWLSLMLRHVQTLEELYLVDCEEITAWLSVEEENSVSTLISSSAYPNDESISSAASAPEGLWCIPLKPISSLKKIFIVRCWRLTFYGSKDVFAGFTSLEELTIRYCPELLPSLVQSPEIPGNLKRLEVDWSPSLESLQLHSCTALEELEIRNCGSLASLEGLQSLRNFKTLKVSCSPSLKSLQLHSCTALEELEIFYCESLAALEGLQYLGNLKTLKVSYSRRSLLLHSCTSLEELEIRGRESLAALERLERLEIDDLSALTTSFCKHLTSLRCLELDGIRGSRDVMSRLTDEQEEALQLLTSLQELKFRRFTDLIDLPAGLHSLRSLKRLAINLCLGISRLPQKGLPPSLEQLDICPCSEELEEQCRMLATSKLKVRIN